MIFEQIMLLISIHFIVLGFIILDIMWKEAKRKELQRKIRKKDKYTCFTEHDFDSSKFVKLTGYKARNTEGDK